MIKFNELRVGYADDPACHKYPPKKLIVDVQAITEGKQPGYITDIYIFNQDTFNAVDPCTPSALEKAQYHYSSTSDAVLNAIDWTEFDSATGNKSIPANRFTEHTVLCNKDQLEDFENSYNFVYMPKVVDEVSGTSFTAFKYTKEDPWYTTEDSFSKIAYAKAEDYFDIFENTLGIFENTLGIFGIQGISEARKELQEYLSTAATVNSSVRLQLSADTVQINDWAGVSTDTCSGLDINSDLVFVVVKFGNGSSNALCWGGDYAVGVTTDMCKIYNKLMTYIKEAAKSCVIPKHFIDHFLQFKAFQVAVEAEHYQEAINFYNAFFMKKTVYEEHTTCNCHR